MKKLIQRLTVFVVNLIDLLVDKLKQGAVLLLIALSACNSFLEEIPDNRVSLDDLDKAAQLMTNAYSDASYAFTDWMSDDFTYTIGTTLRPSHQQMYVWDDPFSDPNEQDTPAFFWYQTYTAIAHANEVLNIIDELEIDETDIPYRDAIKGEALLARAYGHFMLVNLFSEDNWILKDGSGLGVPYIETPETEFLVEYERPSVNKTYEEIEDDLKLGLELVDDSFYSNSGKYHFTKNAALAFASRYYLFTGDFIRCLQYSNELLGSNPGAFVRDMTSEEFRAAKSSTTGYPQLYSSPDLPSNLMLMRKISLVQRTDFAYGIDRNDYGSLFASNVFDDVTDERENPAWVKGQNTLFPVRYESLFERSSINSNVGTPYHIALAFRGEEVLLNRVECNIQLGNNDEAIADLQVLSDRRYSGDDVVLTMELLREFYPSSWTDFTILYEYLILERQKEFIAQGMRWFDLKRFQVPVQHLGPDGSVIAELEADDLRKVLQIPTSAQEVGGLERNER
ncbi:MAG: RagB/SusD family nutrient uptake outer membrane protein [Reichenbachiella sp.]|uniref:RagB/SusD family nutrient uptake outer membrane protein n=1 Tax=Reichenbachiella sp. TaxID=2184521 RepID=UPI002966C59B|nr:RagB/SusD family nutrient uptake outer membrane protein [Reichenbachiella sp.]MDW3210346.1 RagB/SusD family nutrient uptake outer membrane protein [Reichenbachiella sp.]